MTSYCTNIDFSHLDYSNWTGDVSNLNATGIKYPIATWTSTGINGNQGNPILMNTDPCGFTASTDRQIIMSMPIGPATSNSNTAFTNGYDPTCQNTNTGMFDLSLTPSNGVNSIRLGSAYPYYTSEKLVYAIPVSLANCIFNYKYAVVISDGGHLPGEQPAFTLQLKDMNGDSIGGPCGAYGIDATQASTDTSYILSSSQCMNIVSPTYYRKWREQSLDLTAYVGQTVYIEFNTLDCVYSGHYCYAYISAYCSPLQLNVSMCAGSNNQTILAPPGYASYQWYGPNNPSDTIQGPNGTNDTLQVQNGVVGDTYYLDAISVTGCTTHLSVPLSYSKLQITYQTSLLGSFYGSDTLNLCKGDSLTLIVSGATTYTWSANAGSSNNDTVTVFSSGGNNNVYTVIGTNTNGCMDTSYITIVSDTACVWPGDANEDLLVDNTDLLPVGIKFGVTGPSRTFQSNTWQGFACNNWTDTLLSGKNVKYTDCNGDGLISYGDTLAINSNYTRTHPMRMGAPQHVQTANPAIYLQFDKNLYHPGDTLLADVYIGSQSVPQVGFCGAAFTIDYDESNTKPGSDYFTFNNSWVGTINQDMIKFSKMFSNTGIVDASLVRTNQTNVTGYGKVAQLRLTIKDTVTGNGWLYFTTNKTVQTNAAGEFAPLSAGTDSVPVVTNVGIKKYDNQVHFSVFPNPSNGNFTVSCSQSMDEVKVTDILGNIVYSLRPNSSKTSLLLENGGIYFVTVVSGKETTTRRIVVQK
jgi:hypothetical protein